MTHSWIVKGLVSVAAGAPSSVSVLFSQPEDDAYCPNLDKSRELGGSGTLEGHKHIHINHILTDIDAGHSQGRNIYRVGILKSGI